MRKTIVAMIAAGVMIASMIPAVSAYADESAGEAPCYSQELSSKEGTRVMKREFKDLIVFGYFEID